MRHFIGGTGLSCQLLKRLRPENQKFTRLSQNKTVKRVEDVLVVENLSSVHESWFQSLV